MCVQSLDGLLSFFEQGTFAFSRPLNNFLVPGPICYVQKTDSFVTANSQMAVQCYRCGLDILWNGFTAVTVFVLNDREV